MMRRGGCALLVAFMLGAAGGAGAQSTLERTPNLSGGWVGTPRTLEFHFVHRFNHSGAPQRQVQSRPTFLLAYNITSSVLAGARYATRSALAAAVPNEWEAFLRVRPLAAGARVELALQAGYNEAARSVDGEVSVGHRFGAVRPLLALRVLGRDGGTDDPAFTATVGGVVRLHEHVALAADAGRRFGGAEDTRTFWGAGVQLRIPSSPHTLSLHAANTDATTLQSASRAGAATRWGFEFTVPFTPARYFGRRSTADAAAAADTTVTLKALQFVPAQLTVRVGTVVAWRNEDPLEHTVTAVDRSWDSGPIAPQARWTRRFDAKGTYEVFCTPHPFMRAVVIVE